MSNRKKIEKKSARRKWAKATEAPFTKLSDITSLPATVPYEEIREVRERLAKAKRVLL